MEEAPTKVCSNCKREIPVDNYTIHSVHCARNIKVCPVCKEPVPTAELAQHHEKFHKLMPCRQCGEGVCGTDLEDHLRDSCALTARPCRYCELELPRREQPEHEEYCGTRTEPCPTCRELVMLKYRQLHLDSNHGFLKLEDEPGPRPSWKTSKEPMPKSSNSISASSQNAAGSSSSNNNVRPMKQANVIQNNGNPVRPSAHIRPVPVLQPAPIPPSAPAGSTERPARRVDGHEPGPSARKAAGAERPPAKRTNDRPQVNTTAPDSSKVNKNLPASSRGAVKKRPAPAPPLEPPVDNPTRNNAYWSALSRQQQDERRRDEQTAYNLSVGLPPVLSPAAKVEKLRKMDALRNMEFEDHRNQPSRIYTQPVVQPGNVVGFAPTRNDPQQNGERPASAGTRARNVNLMSPSEFINRFHQLQMEGASEPPRTRLAEALQGAGGARGSRAGDDRFGDIKRELRELRRGLNEVTAPYNSAASSPAGVVTSTTELPSPDPEPIRNRERMVWSPEEVYRPPHAVEEPCAMLTQEDVLLDNVDVVLPCEFCGVLVPAHDLVQHQTGCRPDLAQVLVHGGPHSPPAAFARLPPAPGRSPPRAPFPPEDLEPVIPCEFCLTPLPLARLMDHQQRCGVEL